MVKNSHKEATIDVTQTEDLKFSGLLAEPVVTDDAMAEILKFDCDGKVMVTDKKSAPWLTFQDKAWQALDASRAMKPYFKAAGDAFRALQEYYQEASESSDDEEFELARRARNLVNNCGKMAYQARMVTALFAILPKTNIDEWNLTPFQVRFENGIYDFRLKDLVKTKHTDRFTYSTKYDYIDYEKHPQESRDAIDKFLDDITDRNDELKNYILRVLASALLGTTSQEQFYILYGKGRNGKSKLLDLFKAALGDFAITSPSGILKDGQCASKSNEALHHASTRRALCITELQPKGKQNSSAPPVLDTGRLKEISGGDKTSGRQNYGKQREYQPVGYVYNTANTLPTVLDNTAGFWDRVVVIPFNVTFVDKPKAEDQKCLITGYGIELLKHTSTFGALLVKTVNSPEYQLLGARHPPAIISSAHAAFRQSNDVVHSFTSTMFEGPKDLDSYVTRDDLRKKIAEFCAAKQKPNLKYYEKEIFAFMDQNFPNPCVRHQLTRNKKAVRGWPNVRYRNCARKRKHGDVCCAECAADEESQPPKKVKTQGQEPLMTLKEDKPVEEEPYSDAALDEEEPYSDAALDEVFDKFLV
ncbi:hypothetical protein HKX48_008099 [Thoreauomyces humboldtii]|nr:hypothetical protein HKX48_008099 [Thoreauomyces humboldtii]